MRRSQRAYSGKTFESERRKDKLIPRPVKDKSILSLEGTYSGSVQGPKGPQQKSETLEVRAVPWNYVRLWISQWVEIVTRMFSQSCPTGIFFFFFKLALHIVMLHYTTWSWPTIAGE